MRDTHDSRDGLVECSGQLFSGLGVEEGGDLASTRHVRGADDRLDESVPALWLGHNVDVRRRQVDWQLLRKIVSQVSSQISGRMASAVDVKVEENDLPE
jgi:hypothetical protein